MWIILPKDKLIRMTHSNISTFLKRLQLITAGAVHAHHHLTENRFIIHSSLHCTCCVVPHLTSRSLLEGYAHLTTTYSTRNSSTSRLARCYTLQVSPSVKAFLWCHTLRVCRTPPDGQPAVTRDTHTHLTCEVTFSAA